MGHGLVPILVVSKLRMACWLCSVTDTEALKCEEKILRFKTRCLYLARPKALKLQGFRIKLFSFCSQLILLNFRMTLRASFVPFNPTPSSSNFAKPGSTSSTPTKQKFRFGLKTFKLQTVSLIDG